VATSCPVIFGRRRIAGVKAGAGGCHPPTAPPRTASSPAHDAPGDGAGGTGRGADTPLPGGLWGLGRAQALRLQVVFQDDDQGEVAGGQRAQDTARTPGSISTWTPPPQQRGGTGGPTALRGPGRRWHRVLPGVLLEADLSGDGEREDDEDAESRKGEALVCVPGGRRGVPAQRPVGVQRVAHCRGAVGGSAAPRRLA